MDLHQLPAESAFASRHEKFVILDDALAFIGGIDLTRERWDSPEHPAKSPARVNPEGGRPTAPITTPMLSCQDPWWKSSSPWHRRSSPSIIPLMLNLLLSGLKVFLWMSKMPES